MVSCEDSSGTEEKVQLGNGLLAETIAPLTSPQWSEDRLSPAVCSTRVLMWSYSILKYKVITYMGHFDIYIASLPLLPNELRATSLNRTTGLEIMYGCAKLIHRRESLYPSPPLVCKSTKLKLYDTFTNSDFILFCFVFLFFREQNLIQPLLSRQFTSYELSARLKSI